MKPVVLLYDCYRNMVDDCSKVIGQTGLYTTINTFNETNALEVMSQYDRGFGMLTNGLSCLITGWNSHKKPRDQLLFTLRAQERRSPLRSPTPIIVITEDHRRDLKKIALDPDDGNVAAYLRIEDYETVITEIVHKIVFDNRASELNSIAYTQLQEEPDT